MVQRDQAVKRMVTGMTGVDAASLAGNSGAPPKRPVGPVAQRTSQQAGFVNQVRRPHQQAAAAAVAAAGGEREGQA